MSAFHRHHSGQVHDSDALPAYEKQTQRDARESSRSLRKAVNEVIAAQARCWGIREDQARALLLNRKAVA